MEWLKEFLKEIENGEELEKKIAEKIKESYVSKGEYDAVLTVKDDLQEQMKQRDKDIEELKKTAGDNTQLQQKYHDLEQKYKTDTQNLEKKYAESRKHSAVDMAILQAKGKNTKAIKALLDMDKISLKEDGTLEGLDLEGLKSTDGYLFDIEQTHIEGANGGQRGNHMFQNNEDTLLKIARNAAGLQ